MRLTLTNREVGEYARSNQYAMMMFASASEDYFASRCCILNMLSSGFRLASEAVEKMLKAFIYLATGQKSTLRGNDRHNPYLLKQELTATHPDKTLDNFDTLLKKLHNHYQRRYFDNPTSGEGASSEELRQIDELFVYLAETMSMPDEVKYRSRFFADLCDENARRYWRHHHWATERNQALQGKMPLIESNYRQVLQHLQTAPSAWQQGCRPA
jgi:hypothetical protein